MLSSSKIEDVSQNCFVLDVIKFKKMQTSRIISVLLYRGIDRQTDREREGEREREREIDR